MSLLGLASKLFSATKEEPDDAGIPDADDIGLADGDGGVGGAETGGGGGGGGGAGGVGVLALSIAARAVDDVTVVGGSGNGGSIDSSTVDMVIDRLPLKLVVG